MKFIISIFNNKSDNLPQQVVRTWPQLCARFAAPAVRQEKDGPLFSPAQFVANGQHEHKVYSAPGAHYHRLNMVEVKHCTQRHNYTKAKDPELVICELACRLLQNAAAVSLLVLDCDHEVESLRSLTASLKSGLCTLKLKTETAFAIYSTHSHCQITPSNPHGEPRYRVVIPLAAPIPAAQFPQLWQWAASVEGLQIDPQAKDASRIYYTPAKFADEAPYEWHLEEGSPLDWRLVITDCGLAQSDKRQTEVYRTTKEVESNERMGVGVLDRTGNRNAWNDGDHRVDHYSDQRRSPHAPTAAIHNTSGAAPQTINSHARGPTDKTATTRKAVLSTPPWATFTARHAELAIRIMARGHRNARGVYDARCLAHRGKGETGLLYNPATNAVKCNAQPPCSYDQILVAEGLPGGYLPDIEVQSLKSKVQSQRTSTCGFGHWTQTPPPLVTVARLHVIYGLLLAHCLELKPEDEAAINKHWGMEAAYSQESIAWPSEGLPAGRPQEAESNDPTRGRECSIGSGNGSIYVSGNVVGDECDRVEGRAKKAQEATGQAPALIKVCSMPTFVQGRAAAGRLAELFDLRGIPGFFFCDYREAGKIQGSPSWLLNTPRNLKSGALLAPYHSRGGLIIGLRILRSVRDRMPHPWLLTSRGLPYGSRAVGSETEGSPQKAKGSNQEAA